MSNNECVQLLPNGGRIVPITDTLSFDDGLAVVVDAIQKLRSALSSGVYVSVAGPSGAGKTSLADRITVALPGTLVISMDNYLDASRTVIDENFDDFRLIDFDCLANNLRELQQGQTTQMPQYDFTRSSRSGYVPISPPANGIVLVEGTYGLHASIRSFFNLTVSVSGGVHYDLVKRVMRDVKRTGQVAKEVIDQITQTVYPMYKAFIEPDLQTADIRIVNKFNPFSSLTEAMFSVKTTVSAEQVAHLSATHGVRKTEKYYDIYLHPPATAPHECDQWIRLRNLNGRYSVLFSHVDEDGPYSVSRRVEFTVSVKTLGGLMGLGYQIGAVLHRESTELEYPDNSIVVSIDRIEQFGHHAYVQVKGPNKDSVAAAWSKMFGNDSEDLAVPGSYVDLYMQMLQKNAGFAWTPGRSSQQQQQQYQ
jgi:uridine kinase